MTKLDLQTCQALVRPVRVNYYTSSRNHTDVNVIKKLETSTRPDGLISTGCVAVVSTVWGWRKHWQVGGASGPWLLAANCWLAIAGSGLCQGLVLAAVNCCLPDCCCPLAPRALARSQTWVTSVCRPSSTRREPFGSTCRRTSRPALRQSTSTSW